MITEFIKLINKNQSLLLSYSGGLDSTVLLFQLIKFQKKYPSLNLRAIHINHQLNIKSKQWSNHCKKMCNTINIPLITENIIIPNQNNIQAIARKIRYKTIEKHMNKNEILLTAHHLDDQCETLFLSLKRGSGLSGLSGMSYSTILKKNKIIFRPLLQYQKSQLYTWAILNNLHWIEDDSNLKNQYDRNFIRNVIIKKIKGKWPFFINNCYRSMHICHIQEKSLNHFLDNSLSKYLICHNILNIKKFHIIHKETQILIIRRWIQKYAKLIPTYLQIQNIYNHLIINYQKYQKYKVVFKNFEICRYKNKIFKIPINNPIKNKILFWYDYKIPIQLPQELGVIMTNQHGTKIPKPKINDLVSIRFQTDKKILINKKYKTSIKNIWQHFKVPPWNRNRIPCLFYNNKLIYIIGIILIYNPKNNNTNYWNISWVNNFKNYN
ncbi:tRNA(Ile)-lysidine synthase [Buchnera aphidicola (Phyllaphis fagi)]|uniref:tRNA lysidine(34) synthetase TilS n=1 Tax=Buchnera aphidicola TaxID=9 RepID=UPI003464149E